MSRCTKCVKCMWWWDLYDTDEWKCYNRDSRFFHKVTGPETKCEHGCSLDRDRKELRLGHYENRKDEPNECSTLEQA